MSHLTPSNPTTNGAQLSNTPTPIPSRTTSPTPSPDTISLPRLLCLHGGGTNRRIFTSQLRAFLSHPSLQSRFRFVFIDAPFSCAEGVGVYPVYKDYAPYYRWSRWLPSHETVETGVCHGEILRVVREGMDADQGTREWVGVLGFSQGAKVAASLLLKQQIEADAGLTPETNFRFGVIMAGRAPLLALSEEMEAEKWLQSASGLPDEADMDAIFEKPEMKLRVPTVHVHGLRDEGLEKHRRCVEDYCAAGTADIVEWDGPHRVPIKRGDVERVVEAMVGVADEYGVP